MNAHTKQQQDKVFETDFIDSQKSDPPSAHLLALSHIHFSLGGPGRWKGGGSAIHTCDSRVQGHTICLCVGGWGGGGGVHAYMHIYVCVCVYVCVHVCMRAEATLWVRGSLCFNVCQFHFPLFD